MPGDTRGEIIDLLSDPPVCTVAGLVDGVVVMRGSIIPPDSAPKPGRCRTLTGVAHTKCGIAALLAAGWSLVNGSAVGLEAGFYDADTSADGYYLVPVPQDGEEVHGG